MIASKNPPHFLSSRRPLICAACRRGRRDPARGERDRGGRGEGHEHDDEHEHRGAIDGDGRPPSRARSQRSRGTHKTTMGGWVRYERGGEIDWVGGLPWHILPVE